MCGPNELAFRESGMDCELPDGFCFSTNVSLLEERGSNGTAGVLSHRPG